MTAIEPSDAVPEGGEGQNNTTTGNTSSAPIVPVGLWVVLASYILFFPLVAVLAWLSPTLVNPLGTTLIEVNNAVFSAVTLSILELLGIYLGLGLRKLRWRLGVAAVGIVYLVIMIFLIVWLVWGRRGPLRNLAISGSIAAAIFSVFVIAIALSLLVAQRCGVRLYLLDGEKRQRKGKRFQFSLRTMLGVVSAVAVLLAAARSCRIYGCEELFGLAIGFSAGVFATLAAVWALLGVSKPMLPIVIVVLVAFCLGSIELFALGRESISFSFVSGLAMFGVVVPLLFVRSMGYRFLGRAPSEE